MRRYVALFLAVMGILIYSCKKTETPISHTIKYIASADTFRFSVVYNDENKTSITYDSATNGWTKSFTITSQSGFPAQLTIKSVAGHHVVADIYVDTVKVASSASDTGMATAFYSVP